MNQSTEKALKMGSVFVLGVLVVGLFLKTQPPDDTIAVSIPDRVSVRNPMVNHNRHHTYYRTLEGSSEHGSVGGLDRSHSSVDSFMSGGCHYRCEDGSHHNPI